MEADSKRSSLKGRILAALMALGLSLAMVFCVWQIQHSLNTVRVEAREQARQVLSEPASSATSRASPVTSPTATVDHTVNRVLKVMDAWTARMTFATSVTGAGMLLTMLLGVSWWRRAWDNQVLFRQREWDKQAQKLHDAQQESRRQFMARQRLEQELRGIKVEFERRVEERMAEVSAAHAVLEKELNERRHAERSMAHQRQELERSKDVLELHVQARTQELQKLQRRNELILNSAGEGIYGLDLQGKTTFVNPAAAKLTGWKVEELVGRPEREVFYVAGEGGDTAIVAPLSGTGSSAGTEQVFRRHDGSTFPVEYVRTPILEGGRMVGAVVIFKDITERKRTEETLARKAAELARSNAELEQFAYVASHDLQEPLRKIQAFGDRLKAKVDSARLEEGRDYLERMQSAAARMQQLIADLLTFSRVISSSQPFVPVDLNVVTREVLTDLEVCVERTKARVDMGPLPTIDADPLQMRQLLQNLISNSLKFQPPGGTPEVRISAQVLKRPFSCAKDPTPDDHVCELTVQDNGIGFDEKYLDKVFAVFQRLHGRTEYEGTGVGLAVCRRITDRHGGTITAQSKPGEGATFVVTLPARQPKVEGTK